MKQWHLYILRCKDGTLYTGVTDDLPRRLAAHREGRGAKYTRGRAPLALVYQEHCASRADALKREYAVKRLTRAQKLALLQGGCAGKQETKAPLELRAIDESNFRSCLGLRASVENESFVDSVADSLAEAWVFYKDARPFAIYKQEQMIGFVSMYVGEGSCQIVNFLIDDAFRGQGFGTEAAKLCIRYLQEQYHADRISVPVAPEHTAARSFWERLGFAASDNVEDGYIFMRLYCL